MPFEKMTPTETDSKLLLYATHFYAEVHKTIFKCSVDESGQLFGNFQKTPSIRRKRFALEGSKWTTTAIKWNVERYSEKMNKEQVDHVFLAAFKESYTPLRFIKAEEKEENHIKISFFRNGHADDFPFDGNGGELAHAFYPIKGGEIHIDDDEIWAANSKIGRDLYPVAAHEIGHSLGLRHSLVKQALMFPYYKGTNEVVALDQDDIDGIQSIYGMADERKSRIVNSKKNVNKLDPSLNVAENADEVKKDQLQPTSVSNDSTFSLITESTSIGSAINWTFTSINNITETSVF